MDKLLVALYETKRQSLLSTFMNHPARIDPALAFAYENRIAPIFHEDIPREVYGGDPFKEIYSVKAEFMNRVTKHLDRLWRDENYESMAFYRLEDEFGQHGENRVALIHTIEYARISRRFSDDVYDAITRDAPAEANSLDSEFSPNDVFFG